MDKNLLVVSGDILELSDECVARHMLYAQTSALKENGTAYSAAFCGSFNLDTARLMKTGRISVCFFGSDTKGLPDGAFYLQSEKITQRVVGYKLSENETVGSPEELIAKLGENLDDFPVIKPENERVYPIREDESILQNAEIYDTAAAVLCSKMAHTAEFGKAWKELLEEGKISEEISRIGEEAKSALGKNIDEIIRFGTDNIALDCLKMCEDGSGDIVIRIHETQGKDEVHSFIMSDIFDMGFRFDIGAYESKTFRVNADGMVRETNYAEGIIPFNYYVW